MKNINKEKLQVFETIKNTDKNILINAVAGSGKTTTLIESLDFIPNDKTILFTAFNKSIANELKDRIAKKDNLFINTLHGVGFSVLNEYYNPQIDNYKYNKLIYEIYFNKQDSLNKYNLDKKVKTKINEVFNIFKTLEINFKEYIKDLINLINFGRLNYINLKNKNSAIKDLNLIAKYYGINNEDSQSLIAYELIKIGSNIITVIDFTDMIFLPIHLNLKTSKYDFVFVDECVPRSTNILCKFGERLVETTIGNIYNRSLKKKKLPSIFSYNETTKESEYKNITKIWSNGIKDVYYVVVNNRRKIKSTVNHKFLVKDKGWVRLDELKIGDELIINNIFDEREINVVVTQEYKFYSTEEVFDITVADNHNFFITTKKSTFGVIAHNCQDLNNAQINLVKKLKHDDGRFIFVGDDKQSIYNFAGANSQSFNELIRIPNTVELPLSVTYRCPPLIVNMVKNINPKIYSNRNIDDGVHYPDFSYTDLEDNDFVLCRETFPLVSLCLTLIKNNKKSFIIGNDIGVSLIKLIKDLMVNDNVTMLDIFNELYLQKENMIDKIENTQHISRNDAERESSVVMLDEKIKIIEIITNFNDTPNDVINKLENIFNNNKQGIKLSTIHKSKGLEAERVFILQPELLPSRFARTKEEFEQEENLRYVAYTRSKKVLGFITDFDAYNKYEPKFENKNLQVSKFVGRINEKLWLDLKVTDIRNINSIYGETTVYDLVDDKGNLFSKFGDIQRKYSKNNTSIKVGSLVNFYAIIKEHSTFNNKKITKLGKISLF